MDTLVTRRSPSRCQTKEQRYASKIPRYLLLFIALASAASLYLVSTPFCVSVPTCDGLVQYSDFAGKVVRVWLGQDDDGPSRRLPGWSPSSYIGLEADIEKRDAVVAAFRVRVSTPLSFLLHG